MTKTMQETNQYKKGLWTEEEDKILNDYISVHGEGQWNHIAQKTGLKRCGKSCRSRWKNYLSPNVKRGNFTEDEEDLIIRLHNLLGNRWTLIAKRVPGRTENQVKNYWNTHLSKKLAAQRKSGRQSNKGRSSSADITGLTSSRQVKLCMTGTSTDLSLSGSGYLGSEATTVEGNQKTAKVSESDDSDPRESMVTDSYVDSLWITDDALELRAISMEFLDGYSFDLLDIGPIICSL